MRHPVGDRDLIAADRHHYLRQAAAARLLRDDVAHRHYINLVRRLDALTARLDTAAS